jgi:hypothetical protein
MIMKPTLFSSLACAVFSIAHADSFLVEAEQFSQKGGWMVDTQFIETMGSPYLIAHGMGKPVADATTSVSVPSDGNYQVWVRTIDWTKRLKRSDSAGTFSVSVNGKDLGTVLGQGNTAWSWVKAGKIELKKGPAELKLTDLTGFDGRVDAILFSNEEAFTPPEQYLLQDRSSWKMLGAPAPIEDAGTYDLVVVGGGYGGMGAAISAARLGAKVALIQNRMVLGGNGSSEVRVWAKGDTPPSEYALSDIVNEFQDDAKASPAPAEQFEDEKKETIVRAEKNITLFLGHHAYGLDLKNGAISAVNVLEVEKGKNKKISGVLFADCTGHGFIGQWSKADSTMEEKGRMGMSNMWMWENREKPVAFPPQKWMLSLTEKDFPHPRRGKVRVRDVSQRFQVAIPPLDHAVGQPHFTAALVRSQHAATVIDAVDLFWALCSDPRHRTSVLGKLGVAVPVDWWIDVVRHWISFHARGSWRRRSDMPILCAVPRRPLARVRCRHRRATCNTERRCRLRSVLAAPPPRSSHGATCQIQLRHIGRSCPLA